MSGFNILQHLLLPQRLLDVGCERRSGRHKRMAVGRGGSEGALSLRQSFYAETLEFRDRMNFCRDDECVFVKCTLLMDADTEQIAFTK